MPEGGFPDGHVTDYEKAVDAPLRTLAQVGVAWYFGIHLGLDNGIGG
jgi:hypothetical protein